MAAASLLAACGGDDNGGVTVKTSPNRGTEGSFPVRITYIADSPYGKRVSAEQVREGVETLERRAGLLGLNDTSVRAKGRSRIEITYSPKDFAQTFSSQLPVQGRLLFYDFAADLIGSERPIPTIHEAVALAAKRPAVDSPDNTTAKQYYLFGSLDNYRGGPTGSRDALLEKFAGKLPGGSRIETVQPGTVVILAKPLSSSLDPETFNGDYILRDRPQVDNDGISSPEFSEGSDDSVAEGKPSVTFQFTPEGRRQLKRMTAAIARRGAAGGEPGSFAVVLDNQLLSNAVVDPEQNPNGLDGRDGATVYGDFTADQARALAAVLESGPLPFRLIPLLQTQVRSG